MMPGNLDKLLVTMVDDEPIDQRLQLAVRLTRRAGCRLLLEQVVCLPAMLPLKAGTRFVRPARSRLIELVGRLEPPDVPLSLRSRVTHDLATAVSQGVGLARPDLVLVGESFLGFGAAGIKGRLSWALQRRRVALIPDLRSEDPIRRVLVPVTKTMDSLALSLAQELTEPGLDSVVTVLCLSRRPITEEARARLRQHLWTLQESSCSEQGNADHLRWEVESLTTSEPDRALLRWSQEADCLILGAGDEEAGLCRLFGAFRRRRLARRAGGPVVWVGGPWRP